MKTKLLIKLMALLMLCCVMSNCGKEEKPGSIFGVVTDFSTSEPVYGANVQLRPGGETTLTGTDGMYEFPEVPVGNYSITVSKAGYTDLVDDYVIEVKEEKKVRRDVQIKKRPAALHLYDNESQEISELDFGADAGVTQKTFNIFNGGTQEINYVITKTANWITNISQTSGSINVGVTYPIVITIDRGLLSDGDNTTTLLITSSADGGKELTIKAQKSGESPIVTISEAVEVDSTTYRIKCEVVSAGGQAVTERGICWNTFGDPMMEDETIKHSSGGIGQYAIRMEHLSLSTHYYVRAYAKNAVGIGFSEVIDFKTGNAVSLPSVSTVEVDEVTASSVVCLGNVSDNGGADLIECGVCWSKNANPTVAGHHQAAGEATLGVFSVSLTGLNPNTTYHVRCYATNAKGTAYGDDLSFTTTEGLPTVTTAAITNITATSAKGGGDVTEEGASAVSERGICWSTSHNPTTSGSHANSGTGTGNYTVNMTGLTPNATYYVRAYAKNTQGIAYGAEVSFMALEGLPVVTTQEVDNITATTAKGHGTVTDQGGSAVTERGVCWSTEPSPTVSDNHATSGTGEGAFTVAINSLTPGTKYYVRAYAKNNQGLTYGEQKEFTASANLPTVTTATPSNVTQTTATGGGNVTDDGGATVTERGICWSTSHNPTTSEGHVSSGTGIGAFTVEMTDLEPGTVYYVRAYAVNSAGTSYGSEKQLTTMANAPTVVTGEVSNITQTTAQGRGNVTDDGGATVTERGICWSTSHNPTTSGSHANSGTGTGNYTVNMTGLTSNTTYYVRAYAKNSQGTSYGDEVSFRTSQNNSAPTVTTSQVTNITQTTATGGGNVTSDGGATVTERGICWSTSHNPTTSSSHANSGTGTGSFMVNMTGLTANTTYYVRAYATNSQGTSYGSEVSFTTQQIPSYTIAVSSNPTNGGTTTGGGTYQEGQSCTVHATANTGYTFTNWTENGSQVSTNSNYTFTVNANRTLVAHFTVQSQAPTGAINGLFSVSATTRVYFSQANLQYQASTNTWRFAENQYDCIGNANSNISSSYSGWIDLFGWGTSGWNSGAVCYQPWSTSTSYSDYYPGGSYTNNLTGSYANADWGVYNAISNGGNTVNTWRTLTSDEWVYVFNTRTTSSGLRYAKACVNNVNGVILLPDDWSASYYSLSSTNSNGASFTSNTISATQWATLEQHGAVFLAAAGYRNGGASVYAVGSYGYYWSASYCDSHDAYNVYFNGSNLYPQYSYYRYGGQSVRLVRSAQ